MEENDFDGGSIYESRWVSLSLSLLRSLSDLVDDYKILYNDWPYGLEQKIVHLVIWTKFDLEDDPVTDDLTLKARQEIDEFVETMFHPRVPRDRVIWFKNWRSLKSIHAVEHFHVMLYDPDMEFIREITNDDIPLAVKVQMVTEGLT